MLIKQAHIRRHVKLRTTLFDMHKFDVGSIWPVEVLLFVLVHDKSSGRHLHCCDRELPMASRT